MEKLQINHIAPYLPYGLKCQLNRLGVFNLDEEYPIPHNDICEITNLVKVGNDWEVEISGSGDCSFGMIGLDEIEIFLRPMSSLYKEIDGKVGIEELAKIATGIDWSKRCWELSDLNEVSINQDGGVISFSFNKGNFSLKYRAKTKLNYTTWNVSNQLDLFTYLFQHHYDVWDLIGQNLAIDLNSISHE